MKFVERFKFPHRIKSLPILILMPHSSCNCRCVMCDIWRSNANKLELPVEIIQQHIDGFKRLGVKWVVLSGGEALLYRELWLLCELLKDAGIKITLLSTGLLLNKHDDKVTSLCDEVIISLDGPPALHNQIRRIPDAFAQLANGVRALRAIDGNYRITGRCVIQKQNFRHFDDIIETAHDLDLNQISFLAVDAAATSFAHDTVPQSYQSSELLLSRKEIGVFEKILNETIDHRRALFDNGFIAESPAKLRRMISYFRAAIGDETHGSPRCNAPWVSAVVEADGVVRPCFFHDSIGNIKEAGLEHIVNSEAAIQFRKNLDIEKNPTCQKCTCSLYLKPADLVKIARTSTKNKPETEKQSALNL